MIPVSYKEWRDCIENKCGTKLTEDFITKRLTELKDKHNQQTEEFIGKYGVAHHGKVVEWFTQSLPLVAHKI